MKKFSGRHTAENVKNEIEAIVNRYNFNKNKIVCIVTDEGSNFVKLFSLEHTPLSINTQYEFENDLSDDDNDSENDDDANEQDDIYLPIFVLLS